MQHGFAARNGVLAVFLARADYTGIERVLERSHGGFFSTFASGSSSTSTHDASSAFAGFGTDWETENVLIKPYPLCAALHAPVDCVKLLQEKHKDLLQNLKKVKSVKIEMGDGAHRKGGWKLETRVVETISAQMNAAYAVAVQLVDGEVVPTSFALDKLNREVLHDLIQKTVCVHQESFDRSLRTRVTVNFLDDAKDMVEMVDMPHGVQPKLTDEEIMEKWKTATTGLLDEERRSLIVNDVMRIEGLSNLDHLLGELRKHVGCILK